MASKSSKTNLDLNNLHLLNLPARLFIALLVVAAVLGLGYAGLFKSQMESLEEYEAKETELKNTYKQKSIDAASLNNLRDELASIRSAFDIMLKQLPTDAEIPNLVQELHQAGSSNGLRLDSVMPQPPVDDGPIKKLPYSISITGNYEQISQFTRDVGSLSRIITLESLKIAQSPENGGNPDGKSSILNLSAIATTYQAKSVEELAAEAAQNAEQKITYVRETMKHYALLISFLALSACSQNSEDLNEWMAQTRREAKAEIIPFQAPTLPVAPVYSPPQLTGPNAFDFRRMETAKKGENAPDTKRIKETLEKFSLENMRYVGILKSGQKVSGFIEAEGYVYTVGVGNYLGQNYGRIESITDDSIILNELIEDSTGNWVSRKAELLLNSSDKNTEQAAAPAAEQN